MKTTSRTIETKEGKIKVQFEAIYLESKHFGKEKSHYDGYSIREVKFQVEGKEYVTELKTFWNAKRTQVIFEYKIGRSVLANEKQVLEYIFRNK